MALKPGDAVDHADGIVHRVDVAQEAYYDVVCKLGVWWQRILPTQAPVNCVVCLATEGTALETPRR